MTANLPSMNETLSLALKRLDTETQPCYLLHPGFCHLMGC